MIIDITVVIYNKPKNEKINGNTGIPTIVEKKTCILNSKMENNQILRYQKNENNTVTLTFEELYDINGLNEMDLKNKETNGYECGLHENINKIFCSKDVVVQYTENIIEKLEQSHYQCYDVVE